MIKKINIFLVLLLLLVSIGAVSAADDGDAVGCNDTMTDILTSDADEGLIDDVGDDKLSASNTYVVDSSNYATYFPSGKLSPTVKEGATLQIDGSFSDKDFIINRTVNVVGTSTNNMKNCLFTFYEGGSGSTVSNLKIANTKDYTYGVFLNGASNCVIHDCFINNTGQSSYTICVANNANYNNVSNNVLSAYGKTYGHSTRSTPPLLLCNAHYNEIGNNDITCDDANGIYLSSYEGGPLKGGESTFNYIHDNTVKYNVLPTSWAYGIQVMGKNNTISSNRIIGAYRGISTSNAGNVIVDNWIINLTGADYNNPGEETGGEIAIVGSYNSTIKNNHIVNAKVIGTGAGISALDNSVVENNIVEVTLQGKGVYPRGSNITIKNNDITTNSGSGILYDSYSFNLVVIGNNITSNTGVGVLIQKVSNKRMPGNITIVENTISTHNKYAIDALEANADSTNVIERNKVIGGGMVRTPEGSYDPTKPAYVFNGTVHNINPDNYCDYINEDGGLSPDIKTGDILNFIGEFHNKIIKINAPIKITGDNPTFYNTTFRVACDGVWIENLTIINDKASRVDAWGVVIYKVAGATVTNCDIKVYDPQAAYAIYVVESSDIDIINNKLYSSGDYLTYTLLIYAVEDSKFINNTIDTLGTGEVHQWEQEHCLDGDTNCLDGDTFCLDGDTNCLDGDTNCLDGDSLADGNHMLSEVYRTYGILMAYSSDNVISGNKVNATSKLNRTVSPYNSTNSIVGIDAYFNCQNNVFSDNEVYVKAYDNYLYGMGVLGFTTGHTAPEGQGAINDQFINNYINVEGTYCVTGLIIGDETTDTIIKDNIVDLKSDNVAYGVTLEMSQKSTINNNYFEVNSDVIYGVEALSSSDNNIINNEFVLNGKQVYGLVFSNAKSNSVVSNIILANGTGEKLDFKVLDSIPAGNAGVFLKSNSSYNEINKNNIQSKTNYAVLVDDIAVGNVITDNCLDSEKGIGNRAVNNTKNNIVENNYRYTFTGKMTAMKANYLETVKLALNIDDGALVKFYIADNEVGSATSSNGVAALNYKLDESLTPGSYKVKAIATKDNYQTKEFSTILKVNKGNLNVNLDNVMAKPLSEATFTATVTDVSGKAVSGLNVKFYRYQGRYVYIGEATTGNDGVAKLVAEIPSISVDSYVISANVTGNSKFNYASNSATLNIRNEVLDTVLTAKYDSSSKCLVATLKDSRGDPVSGASVGFAINGVKYNSTDANGQAKYSTSGLAAGDYNIKVTFSGNDFYTAAKSVNVQFTLTKASTKLTVTNVAAPYKSDEYILATLKDENGKAISGASIGFTINGVKYNTTDANGEARYHIGELKAGSYSIKVEYNGNDNYKASSSTAKVTVTKAGTVISAPKVNVAYKDPNSELVATIVNEHGKPLVVTLSVNLNGKTYSVKTDANGQASIPLDTLTPGTYTATISYKGSSNYEASSSTAKVTVTKAGTVISAPKVNVAYKDPNGELVATIVNEHGKPLVVTLSVNLNGKTYSVKTDSNGQASIPIDTSTPGTYTATISYKGSSNYEASSTTAKVTVTKLTVISAPNVKVAYKDPNGKLVATIVNENGKPLVVTLSVNLNGKDYTVKTDANGQASIPIDTLTPGTYTATISFKGSTNYNGSSTTAKVTVTKAGTVISAPNVNIAYKDPNGKLVATIVNEHGKPLVVTLNININGKDYTVKTDSNGQASIPLDTLTPGTYTATISYKGSGNYKASTATAMVTVTKAATIITAPDVTVAKNDPDGKLVSTIVNEHGKPLVVSLNVELNGKTYSVKTDSNGQASVSTADLAPGTYTATISYKGSGNYKASSTTANIKVKK